MKRYIIKACIAISLLGITGCAKQCNRMEANGGVIGTSKGDWIVVTYSGNHITDVWKLEDVFVASEEHSDGWLFLDQHKNAVHIGGNAKCIRVYDKSSLQWEKYKEYHSEFTDLTYQEFTDSF